MTRRQLEQTVRLWQARLGLDRWDIRVLQEPPFSPDAEATTERSNAYECADVRFDPSFVSWNSRKAHRIVAHELLHMVFRDVDAAFGSAQGFVQPAAWQALNDRFEFEMEQAVDLLACRLVELLR